MVYDKEEFMDSLSKHYHAVCIKFIEDELTIVFRLLPESNDSELPEIFTMSRRFVSNEHLSIFILSLPKEVNFDNATVFEEFLEICFTQLSLNRKQFINAWNLKLIMKSESLRQNIRQNINNSLIDREPFIIHLNPLLMLEVLDEPVPSLTDIISITSDYSNTLFEFKTFEKLSRLETILGYSIFKITTSRHDYFQNRHVFKYLIETGQQLPEELSVNTRALLKIDFPILNI